MPFPPSEPGAWFSRDELSSQYFLVGFARQADDLLFFISSILSILTDFSDFKLVWLAVGRSTDSKRANFYRTLLLYKLLISFI